MFDLILTLTVAGLVMDRIAATWRSYRARPLMQITLRIDPTTGFLTGSLVGAQGEGPNA